jgi:hypothetical protein
MTDPPRILDVSTASFERALLESASRDHGSSAAQMRCLAAASTATLLVAQTTASAASAVTATSLGAGLALKGVAVGLLLGLGLQGAVVVAHRVVTPSTTSTPIVVPASPRPPLASRQSTGTDAHAVPAIAEAPASTDAHAVPVIAEAPVVNGAAIASKAGTFDGPTRSARAASPLGQPSTVIDETQPSTVNAISSAAFRPLPDDSLEREVQLLDEARSFNNAGQYVKTLDLLARHQQRFQTGSLKPEALVIRVQAVLGLGQRDNARALARQYMIANPNSPVTKRLTSLLSNER